MNRFEEELEMSKDQCDESFSNAKRIMIIFFGVLIGSGVVWSLFMFSVSQYTLFLVKVIGAVVTAVGSATAALARMANMRWSARLPKISILVAGLGLLFTFSVLSIEQKRGIISAAESANRNSIVLNQLMRNNTKIENVEILAVVVIPWNSIGAKAYAKHLVELISTNLVSAEVGDVYEGVRKSVGIRGGSSFSEIFVVEPESPHYPSGVQAKEFYNLITSFESIFHVFNSSPEHYSRMAAVNSAASRLPITKISIVNFDGVLKEAVRPEFGLYCDEPAVSTVRILPGKELFLIDLVCSNFNSSVVDSGRVTSIWDMHGKPFYISVLPADTRADAYISAFTLRINSQIYTFGSEANDSLDPLARVVAKLTNQSILEKTEDLSDRRLCYVGRFPSVNEGAK